MIFIWFQHGTYSERLCTIQPHQISYLHLDNLRSYNCRKMTDKCESRYFREIFAKFENPSHKKGAWSPIIFFALTREQLAVHIAEFRFLQPAFVHRRHELKHVNSCVIENTHVSTKTYISLAVYVECTTAMVFSHGNFRF